MNKMIWLIALSMGLAATTSQARSSKFNFGEAFVEELYDHPINLNIRPQAASSDCQPTEGPFYKVHRVPHKTDNIFRAFSTMDDVTASLDGTVVVIDEIINAGKKVWKILDENQPTLEVKRTSANAVPSGIDCWMDLETWSMPESRVFEVSYRSFMGYGPRVMSFKYLVNYTHSGSLEGVGAYLTNVNIVPLEVDVVTAHNLSAEVSIPSVVNMGTRRSPIAGMQIVLKLTASNVVKKTVRHEEFFVTGDGRFKRLSSSNN